MGIAGVTACPTSFPVPPDESVPLGIGRTVKRDAVVVKVTTEPTRPSASSCSAWRRLTQSA